MKAVHRLALTLLAGAACSAALAAGLTAQVPRAGRVAPGLQVPALKDVFKGDFLIGAALNTDQIFGWDRRANPLIEHHFNTITAENALKWERIHPLPGKYDFVAADRYVEYGQQHGMFIVGHTLVWHSQTPAWVFQDAEGKPVSRDTLLARLKDHIQTIVGRYHGRVNGWDVVNEALAEDGTLRNTPWRRIIGDDYIEKAFQWAHEADPGAQLYYNDYGLENPRKRAGVVSLVQKLKAAGVPIYGVGTQEHDRLEEPAVAQIDSLLDAIAATGVKAMVTELDVGMVPRMGFGADVSARTDGQPRANPFAAGLPDSVAQAQARRYGEIFAALLRHRDVVTRVTFWGVTDGDSWLNNWPVPGRTEYPLLFDRAGRPKPAFARVVEAAHSVAVTP